MQIYTLSISIPKKQTTFLRKCLENNYINSIFVSYILNRAAFQAEVCEYLFIASAFFLLHKNDIRQYFMHK